MSEEDKERETTLSPEDMKNVIWLNQFLSDLENYHRELSNRLSTGVHPEKYILENFLGEQFIDGMILTENLRASARAKKSVQPKENLGMCEFASTTDFFRYLNHLQYTVGPESEPFKLRAYVPSDDPGHSFYCTVRRKNGKTTLVLMDSSTETIAKTAIDEIIKGQKNYPNAIHAFGAYMDNKQKSAVGCPSFSVSTGAELANSEDPDLDSVHDELEKSPRGTIKCVVDSYAARLPVQNYKYTQSIDQVEIIRDNPRHAAKDIEESFTAFHPVTQNVRNLKTDEYEDRTFNNAIDRYRVDVIGELVIRIKELIQKHSKTEGEADELGKAKAASIIGDMFAKLKISRQQDWDRHLPKTRALCTTWDLRKGESQLNEHWPQLTPNERAEMAGEILDAMPNWRNSPTLRINCLETVESIIKSITSWRFSSDANIQQLVDSTLAKVPEVIRKVVDDHTEKTELESLLRLNKIFMSRLPSEKRLDHLEALSNFMMTLNDVHLSSALGLHLAEFVAEDCAVQNRCDPTHTALLLRTANKAISLTESPIAKQVFSQLAEIGFNFEEYDSGAHRQFKSILELAANVDKTTLDGVIENDTKNDMRAVASRLQKGNSNWLPFQLLDNAPYDDFDIAGSNHSEPAYVIDNLDAETLKLVTAVRTAGTSSDQGELEKLLVDVTPQSFPSVTDRLSILTPFVKNRNATNPQRTRAASQFAVIAADENTPPSILATIVPLVTEKNFPDPKDRENILAGAARNQRSTPPIDEFMQYAKGTLPESAEGHVLPAIARGGHADQSQLDSIRDRCRHMQDESGRRAIFVALTEIKAAKLHAQRYPGREDFKECVDMSTNVERELHPNKIVGFNHGEGDSWSEKMMVLQEETDNRHMYYIASRRQWKDAEFQLGVLDAQIKTFEKGGIPRSSDTRQTARLRPDGNNLESIATASRNLVKKIKKRF